MPRQDRRVRRCRRAWLCVQVCGQHWHSLDPGGYAPLALSTRQTPKTKNQNLHRRHPAPVLPQRGNQQTYRHPTQHPTPRPNTHPSGPLSFLPLNSAKICAIGLRTTLARTFRRPAAHRQQHIPPSAAPQLGCRRAVPALLSSFSSVPPVTAHQRTSGPRQSTSKNIEAQGHASVRHANHDALAAQVCDVVDHRLHAGDQRLTSLQAEALGSRVPVGEGGGVACSAVHGARGGGDVGKVGASADKVQQETRGLG